MNIKQVVGANLFQIRESRGLNQSQVADACGFEPPSYSRWENGKSWPSPDTIQKLADFYEVPVTFFYRDDSARKVKPSLYEALNTIEEETGIVIKIPKSFKSESDGVASKISRLDKKRQEILLKTLDQLLISQTGKKKAN